jgi:hypothetical protein
MNLPSSLHFGRRFQIGLDLHRAQYQIRHCDPSDQYETPHGWVGNQSHGREQDYARHHGKQSSRITIVPSTSSAFRQRQDAIARGECAGTVGGVLLDTLIANL